MTTEYDYRDPASEAEEYMQLQEEPCERCGGRGWADAMVVNAPERNCAEILVARCKHCGLLASDCDAAWAIMQKANAAPDLLHALARLREWIRRPSREDYSALVEADEALARAYTHQR